jgi:signal transduction histidine kinase/uncharacterized protein HemY
MKDLISDIERRIAFSEGKRKIELLNELSEKIEVTNPQKALDLSKEAYRLSTELGYERDTGWSLLCMAYACRRLSNYEEGMSYLFKALKIFENLKEADGQGRALTLIGVNYFYYGRYEQALKYSLKSVKKAKKAGNKVLEASTLNNIGEIYGEQEKYQEALDYYFRSLKVIEEIDHKRSHGVILNNIGSVYCKMGQCNKGLIYYEKSLRIFKEISERIYEGDCLNKIGEIFQSEDKNKEALNYYFQSLKILQEEGNKFYIIDVLINLGKIYLKMKSYHKVLEYFQKALSTAEDITAKKKMYIIHLCLSEYYENIKDFEKSLYHYKIYESMEKEIVTVELQERLKILTMSFNVEKAQQEAEIYRLKNKELRKKNEEIRIKAEELKKNKEKLERLEKSRQQLLSNISHDLRTPITSIQGYIEAMQDGLINSEEGRKKYLERIHSKIFILKRLIDDLFQLAKLESRQMTFYFKHIRAADLLKSIYIKYELDVKKADKKLIIGDYKFDIEDVFISIDLDRIDQVFGNLIFNALKFVPQGGVIELCCERKSLEEIVFKIKDNGKGISEEDIPNIFERFYKGSKSRDASIGSSGLGLSIAREIVEYHGGRIWVENNSDKGCTFYFTTPIITVSEMSNTDIKEKNQPD